MFTAYLLVKLIHILGAIVGMGFALSFGIIMSRAAQSPASIGFALRTISVLARIGTWGFTVAIVTGLAMGHLGAIGFRTLWFSASLVISILAMAIAGAVARPSLERQIVLSDGGEAALPELRRRGARSAKVGMLLHLLSLALIGLMIFKPTL